MISKSALPALLLSGWMLGTGAAPADAQVFLSDLTPTIAINGWGPVEKDRSNGEALAGDGAAMKINGQTFAKGLGVHATSDVRYTLNGQYSTFTAIVGIDDEVGNLGSVIFEVWKDGVKAWSSQKLTGADNGVPVTVDVSGTKEIRLVVTDAGDGLAYDHANWADAKVSGSGNTPAPSSGTFVSDLTPTYSVNGWGPFEKDKSNGELAAGDGIGMKINGQAFAKGLGVHAFSDLRFNLNGTFATFTAVVGVDDEVGTLGSVVFEVWKDGVKAWSSQKLTGADNGVPVTVDVTGTKELRLVVTDAGDGLAYDHANWADAKVSGSGNTPAPSSGTFVSDLTPTYSVNGWGPFEKDKSNGELAAGDGIGMKINGQAFAKGLGVHAFSDLRFNLNGTFATFTAVVGVDDEVGTLGSVVFEVWKDGVKAWSSQKLTGADKGVPVTVDVTGTKELRLVVTDAGDGLAYDHANWADAKVSGSGNTPAPSSGTFVSDLTPTYSVNGWGPFEKDKSNGESLAGDGVGMKINGKAFAKGLGVHAYSDLRYNLNGAYKSFTATVGVDDEVGNFGSVVFEVWKDGVKAWSSQKLTGADNGVPVTLDITGTKELRLVVTDAGDGPTYDHANWADAQLSGSGGGTPPPPPPPTPPTPPTTPGTPVYLSDLTWTSATNGSGPVEKDRSNGGSKAGDGKTLTLNGVTYSKGLGTKARSDIRYALNGQYNIFSSVIGIDAEGGLFGSVNFEVYKDGVKAYTSPLLTGISEPIAITVNITGVNELRLVVTDGGDGNFADFGDWADAKVSAVAQTPLPVPGGVTATPRLKAVEVSWNAVTGADSYEVYRTTTSNGQANAPVASQLKTLKFLDTGLVPGTRYFYKVVAVAANGVSPRSAEASAIPRDLSPNDPVTMSATRLLRQATFGPNTASIDEVLSQGESNWINSQLNQPLQLLPESLAKASNTEALQEYAVRKMAMAPDQLRQRVAWALHKIWVVSGNTVTSPEAMYRYTRVLENRAFSNYFDLMYDVTLTVAMGEYLNMVNNRKGDAVLGTMPNENYARELLQLFTTGTEQMNLDGTLKMGSNGMPLQVYDQQVIMELSRALTGWTYPDQVAGDPTKLNPKAYHGPMEPVQSLHDTGAKTFFGQTIPAGQTARKDLEDALRIIFNHPNVPPFVSKQLIQQLVKSNPSPQYVRDVASVFANNGSGVRGDMRAVIRAILTHPEAAQPAPEGRKLQEPLLYTVALIRALNGRVADTPFITDIVVSMGQRVYYPPSVFSYFRPEFMIPGFDTLSPEFQLYTGPTSTSRTNYAASMAAGEYNGCVTLDWAQFNTYTSNPTLLVDQVAAAMGAVLSSEAKSAIVTAVSAVTNADERIKTAFYLTAVSPQYQVER